MDNITYYRLVSPYPGDITKNCSLTGVEVDNNFFTLEGRDIKSIEVADDKLVITLMNGTVLDTEKLTQDCVKDVEFSFNKEVGELLITVNGEEQVITGFISDTIYNEGKKVSSDSTLRGNGLDDSPLGVNPALKTGQYKAVKGVVDLREGSHMPVTAVKGDRYVSIENVNEYGYLYNYNAVKQITCALEEANSAWRVPTKDDWDDMLNAVEPNPMGRNHNDTRTNKYLGQVAGKFLKSTYGWINSEEEDPTDCPCDDCPEACNCNQNICNPVFYGEMGICRYQDSCNPKGIDVYGFKVLPTGYSNDDHDYLYYGERGYFWTADNHEYRDAYVKAFVYNKSTVLQDIIAADNYFSLRLVKDYDGSNYNEVEDIVDGSYSTVLMPSLTKGHTVWTDINVAIKSGVDECDYTLPNDGHTPLYTTKYFVNEFDGIKWLRTEMAEGDEVLVFGNEKDILYRLVDGELVDTSTILTDEVIERITPILTEINTRITDETEAREAADNELSNALQTETESREAADTALSESLAAETEARTSADETLNTLIATEIENRISADEALSQRITAEEEARVAKDEEIEGKLIVAEGTEFDTQTGVLTLKSHSGNSDINVQFNMNFGSF